MALLDAPTFLARRRLMVPTFTAVLSSSVMSASLTVEVMLTVTDLCPEDSALP